MTRIDMARKAYAENNLEDMRKAHAKEAIEHGLSHKEGHSIGFTLPEIILGGQDGLVNVLGVILGVAAATGSNHIVIVAGLAAAFAESISMGAVAYTSKIAEADYYQSEYEREKWEIDHYPEGETAEIRQLYAAYGFEGETLNTIVKTITSKKEMWLKVMMEQELKLEPVERKEAIPAAFIVGISAIVGSFIPLTSYFFLPMKEGMIVSLVISALTLFIVGFYKAKKTIGRNFIKQGLEMMVIGMVSAIVGYFIGSLFQVKGF